MGSCGVRTIKDDDGGSYDLELRDRGDYYEGVPKRVYVKDKAPDQIKSGLGFLRDVLRVDLSRLHFKVPSHYVFRLPKPKPEDPPLDEAEYNKIVCETNRELLASVRREYSIFVNSYIEKNNAEADEKYYAAIRDCKKKHGLDVEKINSVLKEEGWKFFRRYLLRYYNGYRGERDRVITIENMPEHVAKMKERNEAKLKEALSV